MRGESLKAAGFNRDLFSVVDRVLGATAGIPAARAARKVQTGPWLRWVAVGLSALAGKEFVVRTISFRVTVSTTVAPPPPTAFASPQLSIASVALLSAVRGLDPPDSGHPLCPAILSNAAFLWQLALRYRVWKDCQHPTRVRHPLCQLIANVSRNSVKN